MINPHYCYIGAFLLSLAVYQFGWSDYLPPLSFPIIIFISATLILNFISSRFSNWTVSKINLTYHSLLVYITLALYVLWAIEFIYEGGIPILKIISGADYDYRLFGIPTLHVLIVTFSSFFTTYLLHVFLSTRMKRVLYLYLINLLAAILIVNRGMLMLNVVSGIFVFLLVNWHFNYKTVLRLTIVSFGLLGIFGVLGHMRVSHSLNQFYDRSIVYEIGEANDSFKTNYVPSEFFWSYLYIASPLGNLQHTLDQPITTKEYKAFIVSEWLPDFISKRIHQLQNTERKSPALIAEHLNASTTYARAYAYLGWTGLVIMAFFIASFAPVYQRLVPKNSPYFLTGLATLNTLYCFLIFDNFFVFSGFSFQLVYPVLLHILEKRQVLTLTPKAS